MHLIQEILKHRLRVGHLEYGVGYAILPFGAAVEQIRFHPCCVFGVLDEEMGKVGMVADPLLDHVPIPVKRTRKF